MSNHIFGFNQFIVERLGINRGVLRIATELFDYIQKQPEKMVYNFSVQAKGETLPAKVVIDSDYEAAGSFTPKRMTITLRKRNDFDTLVHELKHLHRYLATGKMPQEQDWTQPLMLLAKDKLDSSIFNKKDLLKLYHVLYFIGQDEFEAYYHHIYMKFLRSLEQSISLRNLTENSKPITQEEINDAWIGFLEANRDSFPQYQFLNSSMTPGFDKKLGVTIPTKQSPFEFKNWVSENVVDSVIYLFIRITKQAKTKEYSFLDKIKEKLAENKFASELLRVLNMEIPESEKAEISRMKNQIEKEINKRKERLRRKLHRIPIAAAEFIQN
jgi:hypothetical protein